MPPPFHRLTMPQFAAVLEGFNFTRRITAVHMHHTWRPDHSMWRGAGSMDSMWRFHTRDRGFRDIAQHLTIDPHGQVWTGRDWNAAPASAVGHNGNGRAGPFMFEIVGNFDAGADPFEGAQREAVLDVITLVQRKFGLDAQALMFHNQASGKSCPGTSIDRSAFIDELRAHAAAFDAQDGARVASMRKGGKGGKGDKGDKGENGDKGAMPLPASALADTEVVRRTLEAMARSAADVASRGAIDADADADTTPLEELDYSHDMHAHASRDGAPRGTRLTAAEIDALRPYVINLRQGVFSSDGQMTTDAVDVDTILLEHADKAAKEAVAKKQPFRVLLYAHGGLVKESSGLRVAQSHVGWWRDNGVYPIHFVWETGFCDTIVDLLTKSRQRVDGARGFVSDRIVDPLLERAVRALQGPRIWGSMKSSAEKASAPGGGALYFVERLAEFCQRFAQTHGASGATIELHAAGHSAGSVFLAHLLKLAAATQHVPAFSGVHFMAPAIRTDTFKLLVQPLVKKTTPLTLYTMRRDFERDDHCAHIYRKSLLHLVSAACEPEGKVPLLGLEESLRADADLRQLFGLASAPSDVAEVVWSPSDASEGRSASRATTHPGFDEDAPTMESIARRVLRLADAQQLSRRFPAGGARGGGDPWLDGVDWPEEMQSIAPTGPMPGGPGAPGGGSDGAARPDPASVPATPPPRVSSTNRRKRALCVGINTYRDKPLSGCVNDARQWQQTLEALGFQVELLRNDEARLEPLTAAIERLIRDARDGDEIVFQFAGHGTRAPDDDGDEAGGDTPGFDEAMCPHGYEDGPLLLDDDLGAMINVMARGVRLTLFMDCCHAGTNSRVAPMRGGVPRSVQLTPSQKLAFAEWRRRHGSRRTRGAAKRSVSDPVEVNLAACQSHELAWESDGSGDFTRHALRILRDGGAAFDPDTFRQRLVDAFGTSRRQTPHMKAPPERLSSRLFLD